jgi:hypothetical protein
MATVMTTSQVRWRSVALPVEHGGWGFVLEPILLGLLVAPSLTGMLIGIAALGVFLLHQPLKIALKDRLNGKTYARTIYAQRFALGYAGIAAAGGILALISGGETQFWLPLVLTAPFALAQLWYDSRNRGREMLPELLGAVVFAAVAPAIAVAGGWSLAAALPLWAILAARDIPSILYVRARLRLEKGKPVEPTPSFLSQIGGALVGVTLAITGNAPWTAALALVILAGRAILGLSRYRVSVPAKVIGFREIGFGLMTVILTAAGYSFF